jgi:hypothetical protein
MSQEKYIGMDVHQATVSVAVMDRVYRLFSLIYGIIVGNRRWRSEPSQ